MGAVSCGNCAAAPSGCSSRPDACPGADHAGHCAHLWPRSRRQAACKMNVVDQIMAVMEAAFEPHWGEKWSRGQIADSLLIPGTDAIVIDGEGSDLTDPQGRSEERREGKESDRTCRSLWGPEQ